MNPLISCPILFTGSSIIAMWDNLPDFFPTGWLRNTAVSGSQTHELLARLDELVLAHAPRLVCYYCGSNDINEAVPTETIQANILAAFHRTLQALPGCSFVYLSIIRAPQKRHRWDQVDAVNTALAAYAASTPGFEFIDVNPLFFGLDGEPRADFYVEDQLHLTPAAYQAMGQYLAPRVLSLLPSE